MNIPVELWTKILSYNICDDQVYIAHECGCMFVCKLFYYIVAEFILKAKSRQLNIANLNLYVKNNDITIYNVVFYYSSIYNISNAFIFAIKFNNTHFIKWYIKNRITRQFMLYENRDFNNRCEFWLLESNNFNLIKLVDDSLNIVCCNIGMFEKNVSFLIDNQINIANSVKYVEYKLNLLSKLKFTIELVKK